MPMKIKGQFDVVVDRSETGTLFVTDSSGKVLHSPEVAEDDAVIQWAINYVDDEYIRKALAFIFDISRGM